MASSTAISDRFNVIVDTDAAPTDWDDAVATFLLRLLDRRRLLNVGDTSEASARSLSSPPQGKGREP
jgi:hypothetical protein